MQNQDNGIIKSFFEELGISPAADWDELCRRCEAVSGLTYIQQVMKIVNDRGQSKKGLDKALYNKKNTNFGFALTFTGGVDYNYLSNLFDWILKNEKYFGATILDVGCDIGIVSCFLGRLFPDKQIIAIDKFEKSIAIAQKLSEKLNVKNVVFKRTDVAKVDGVFDTVFSSRTMHENVGSTSLDMSRDLQQICDTHKELASAYSRELTRLVAFGGFLVSCERCEIDPAFAGWMLALNEREYSLINDSYSQLKAQEVDRLSSFQAGIYQKSAETHDVKEIMSFFSRLALRASRIEDIKGNWGTADKWASLVALDECADALIEGYMSYAPRGGFPVARYGVYHNRYDYDSSLVYQYVRTRDVRVTNNTVLSALRENVDGVRKSANDDLGNGYTVYKIRYDNGVESRGEVVQKKLPVEHFYRREQNDLKNMGRF